MRKFGRFDKMNLIIFCFLFPVLVLTALALETEQPEPTEPPAVTYEVRLRWGFASDSDVYEYPASYTTAILDLEPPSQHSYNVMILDPTVAHFWSAKSPDYTASDPKTLLFSVYIDHIAGPWDRFGFYRLEARQVLDSTFGDWSPISFWVAVIDLRLDRFIRTATTP